MIGLGLDGCSLEIETDHSPVVNRESAIEQYPILARQQRETECNAALPWH